MKVLILFILMTLKIFSIDVTIIVPENVKLKYNDYFEGRNPLEQEEYPNSNRDIVELVIVQKAILLGGLEVDSFNIIGGPTNDRIMAMLAEGKADLKGTSAWKSEIDKSKLLTTIPSIDNGEFYVGFYTVYDNLEVLESKSKEDLKNLSFVSSSQWVVDWATLKEFEPRVLQDTPKWKNMVNLVGNARVDIMLAPFQSSDDLSFVSSDYKFVPIPNLKIALLDSRNFVVSKSTPNSLVIFKALNKGLNIMKRDGSIKKLYTDGGFYNDKVEDWQIIE